MKSLLHEEIKAAGHRQSSVVHAAGCMALCMPYQDSLQKAKPKMLRRQIWGSSR